ncbi:MAG TPA: PSD1 and planctomycete cytochrome C domain-containing protein, partial [Gemmataceae bacterium]|nr:PSD1 and planctomycete cytochrome C domain-containing protein [Gemmataceae bacterium]
RAALLRGGDGGPAVVPGDPDRSLLVQAVRRTHADLKMPPGKPLPEAAVADLAAWVKQGAAWPRSAAVRAAPAKRHWAFLPVKDVTPPPDPSGWSANPIDRFVLAKLRAQGLRPVAPADRRTLIRRVTFDLIGLPPTPAEVDAFLADDAPDAYPRLVERLLASPQYGERWGRHWMDVVRYADTAGDNADYPVPEARLYRDYIIDSFNADKPYDQFVREQLAGDILAKSGPRDRYAERVIATGFLALSRRYATGPYELWHLTLEDTIDTTGRAFLGLTLRCARCHDHKFDPIPKEDYYALYGVFASTQFPWAGAEELASMKRPRQHFAALVPPNQAAPRLQDYAARIAHLQAEMKRLDTSGVLAQRRADLDGQIASLAHRPRDARTEAEGAALRKERDQVQGQIQATLNRLQGELTQLQRPGAPAGLPVAYAVQEGTPVDAYVQIRGEVDQHGPVVKRGVPGFLGGERPAIPAGSSGRLELARWIASKDNPLTARVMVNRVWQHHFGRGLVATPSDFGTRGEPPTHPELLDWLAARFVESGWSVKALHRLILLSRTYQLSSADDDADLARDPGNRLCWRHDRRRLDAEAIRDAILRVSGTLDASRPGRHPFPPMTSWGWTQHNPFKEVYPSNHRSVYLMTQRFQRHPYLGLFDGPDTNTSTAERTSSTVPQQALFLMNSAWMRDKSEAFARRLLAVKEPRRRVELLHRLAWSRRPRPEEVEKGLWYVAAYERGLTEAGVPAGRRELEAWASYCRVLLCANEFVYLD